jgi:hypothetical protein
LELFSPEEGSKRPFILEMSRTKAIGEIFSSFGRFDVIAREAARA